MMEYLYRKKFKPPISLTFTLFKGSNRKIDRSNILSITEKFFCDALTTYGCIPDDNDEFISETRYRTGGVDTKNPRVEIEIKESL
jgi:Holliday junction resolvase RusA-like endonuclease